MDLIAQNPGMGGGIEGAVFLLLVIVSTLVPIPFAVVAGIVFASWRNVVTRVVFVATSGSVVWAGVAVWLCFDSAQLRQMEAPYRFLATLLVAVGIAWGISFLTFAMLSEAYYFLLRLWVRRSKPVEQQG